MLDEISIQQAIMIENLRPEKRVEEIRNAVWSYQLSQMKLADLRQAVTTLLEARRDLGVSELELEDSTLPADARELTEIDVSRLKTVIQEAETVCAELVKLK